MGEWTDNATNAPSAPPRGFAKPVVKPLITEEPAAKAATAAVEPARQPDQFEAPSKPGLALDQIEPRRAAERDPSEPFGGGRLEPEPEKPWDPTQPLVEVETAPIGRGPHSAWTAAQARRPAPGAAVAPLPPDMRFPPPVGRPVTAGSAPPPVTTVPVAAPGPPAGNDNRYVPPANPANPVGGVAPTNASPPAGQAASRVGPGGQLLPRQTVPAGPLTLGQAVRAAGYPMLGALAGAAFFQNVGFYLLFLALILSGQVQREMGVVRLAMFVVVVARLFINLAPAFGARLPWNATEMFTSIASVVLLVGTPAWIFIASRRQPAA